MGSAYTGDAPSAEWLVALPKAEVHVHLEGGFSATDVAQLADAVGEPLPRPVDDLFTVANLTEFLELLDWCCALVRTSAQVSDAAYRLAAREHASGVGYADVIVNPTHWPAWRDRLDEFLAALHVGFSRAERDGLPSAGICVSLLRQQSAAEATDLVEWLSAHKPARVVALS